MRLARGRIVPNHPHPAILIRKRGAAVTKTYTCPLCGAAEKGHGWNARMKKHLEEHGFSGMQADDAIMSLRGAPIPFPKLVAPAAQPPAETIPPEHAPGGDAPDEDENGEPLQKGEPAEEEPKVEEKEEPPPEPPPAPLSESIATVAKKSVEVEAEMEMEDSAKQEPEEEEIVRHIGQVDEEKGKKKISMERSLKWNVMEHDFNIHLAQFKRAMMSGNKMEEDLAMNEIIKITQELFKFTERHFRVE